MTVGCVAGDEESYTVFKDLFDPIIQDRHGGFKPTDKHKTDLNHENLKVGCPRGRAERGGGRRHPERQGDRHGEKHRGGWEERRTGRHRRWPRLGERERGKQVENIQGVKGETDTEMEREIKMGGREKRETEPGREGERGQWGGRTKGSS